MIAEQDIKNWTIVDYRRPKKGEQYIYDVGRDDERAPRVFVSVSDHSASAQARVIIKPPACTVEVGTNLIEHHARDEIKALFHEAVEERRPQAIIVNNTIPTQKEIDLALELAETKKALRLLTIAIRSHERDTPNASFPDCFSCQQALRVAEVQLDNKEEV